MTDLEEALETVYGLVHQYGVPDQMGNISVHSGQADINEALLFLQKHGRARVADAEGRKYTLLNVAEAKWVKGPKPLSKHIKEVLFAAANKTEAWWTTRQISEYVMRAGYKTKNPQRILISVHAQLLDLFRANVIEKHVQVTPHIVTWRLRPELALTKNTGQGRGQL